MFLESLLILSPAACSSTFSVLFMSCVCTWLFFIGTYLDGLNILNRSTTYYYLKHTSTSLEMDYKIVTLVMWNWERKLKELKLIVIRENKWWDLKASGYASRNMYSNLHNFSNLIYNSSTQQYSYLLLLVSLILYNLKRLNRFIW